MNQVNDICNSVDATDGECQKAPGWRALPSGKLIFNQQSSALNCIARDTAETGACLEIASPVGVPEQFDLFVDGVGIRADCWAVWQYRKRIRFSRAKLQSSR